MKIIASDDEPGFEFERAWVGGREPHLEPLALVGGIACRIETKPGPLQDGIALCQPVEGFPDWPVWVMIERSHEDGTVDRQTLFGFTSRPGVVAAARRFQALAESGDLRVGMTL
ncbi:MAG: hypothetical protein JNL10_11410 [Verrucomicrobiales bacterium]|nr:hypothetical protein [Verrucomicrobiales bacterium]